MVWNVRRIQYLKCQSHGIRNMYSQSIRPKSHRNSVWRAEEKCTKHVRLVKLPIFNTVLVFSLLIKRKGSKNVLTKQWSKRGKAALFSAFHYKCEHFHSRHIMLLTNIKISHRKIINKAQSKVVVSFFLCVCSVFDNNSTSARNPTNKKLRTNIY